MGMHTKVIKAQMLKYEKVEVSEGRNACGLPVLNITVPTSAGPITVEDIAEEEAAGILFAGRGRGFKYHSEWYFKSHVEDMGHQINLIEKED